MGARLAGLVGRGTTAVGRCRCVRDCGPVSVTEPVGRKREQGREVKATDEMARQTRGAVDHQGRAVDKNSVYDGALLSITNIILAIVTFMLLMQQIASMFVCYI